MKKIWLKIQEFFIKLFGGLKKFEKFVQDHMGDIISIVGNLLEYADSPILNDILLLLPEKLKNAGVDAQQKVIKVLTDAIKKLNISNDCLSKEKDMDIILCFLQAFSKRNKMDKESTAAKLAAVMLQIKSQSELKMPLKDSQADYLSAEYFFANKINIIEAQAA